VTWAPDYVTVAVLKSYLRITDTADDVFLALWATTASRNVDEFCQRQFGKVATAEARVYTPVWDRHLRKYVTQFDDLQDVTGLIVTTEDGTVLTSDDYTLWPRNAVAKGRPYERITTPGRNDLTLFGAYRDDLTLSAPYLGELTVTASWGWTAVPSAVSTGLFLQAARLAARRDSPFGIAGSPGEGSEIRLLAQLDPDFRTALKPLRRNWWAA
jgi:hypothetical protein